MWEWLSHSHTTHTHTSPPNYKWQFNYAKNKHFLPLFSLLLVFHLECCVPSFGSIALSLHVAHLSIALSACGRKRTFSVVSHRNLVNTWHFARMWVVLCLFSFDSASLILSLKRNEMEERTQRISMHPLLSLFAKPQVAVGNSLISTIYSQLCQSQSFAAIIFDTCSWTRWKRWKNRKK